MAHDLIALCGNQHLRSFQKQELLVLGQMINTGCFVLFFFKKGESELSSSLCLSASLPLIPDCGHKAASSLQPPAAMSFWQVFCCSNEENNQCGWITSNTQLF